jgi:hypothetical protein
VFGSVLKVFDKFGSHAFAVGLLRRAENGRWMIGSRDPFDLVAMEEFTAMLGEPEIAAEHGLRGSSAEADNDVGFDNEYFGVKPRSAGFDLTRGGFLVETTLAAGLPPKVLHNVGNVDVVARYSSFVERIIEQSTSRSNKWLALPVFFVARHFAKQDHTRPTRAFTEDSLSGLLIKIATFALRSGFSQCAEVEPRG